MIYFSFFSKDFIFLSKVFTFSISRFKVFSLGSISLFETAYALNFSNFDDLLNSLAGTPATVTLDGHFLRQLS